MSLYECSRCGAVENTALTSFWVRQHEKQPQLCSECETGKWHGRWPKESVAEYEAREGVGTVKYRVRKDGSP